MIGRGRVLRSIRRSRSCKCPYIISSTCSAAVVFFEHCLGDWKASRPVYEKSEPRHRVATEPLDAEMPGAATPTPTIEVSFQLSTTEHSIQCSFTVSFGLFYLCPHLFRLPHLPTKLELLSRTSLSSLQLINSLLYSGRLNLLCHKALAFMCFKQHGWRPGPHSCHSQNNYSQRCGLSLGNNTLELSFETPFLDMRSIHIEAHSTTLPLGAAEGLQDLPGATGSTTGVQ